jgi:hypothetical protein
VYLSPCVNPRERELARESQTSEYQNMGGKRREKYPMVYGIIPYGIGIVPYSIWYRTVRYMVSYHMVLDLRVEKTVCVKRRLASFRATQGGLQKLLQPGKDLCLPCKQRLRRTQAISSAQVAAEARARSSSLRQRCSLSTVPFASG